MTEEQTPAKKAVGEIDGEFVAYATWTPEHDGLDTVHFAYAPLTSNRMQQVSKAMDSMRPDKAMRMSVKVVTEQVRVWDAKTIRGEAADPRNALTIGGEMDYNVVEGVAGIILDSRRDAEAAEALADFPRP